MYAMILGISSYLLAISSTWGCYFATVKFIFVDDSPAQYQYPEIDKMGVGLFSYEDITAASDLTCKLYSKAQMNSFDTGFKVARTCGILANILIGLSMIFLVCLSCTVVRKSTLRIAGAMLILGGILEGLTFVLYASEVLCETCELFFGSGLALMCSLVTILNGIITCRIPEVFIQEIDGPFDVEYDEEVMKPTSYYSAEDDDDQSVGASSQASEESQDSQHSERSQRSLTVQIQSQSGTRQIVKTIVNSDGSRAIEQTTFLDNDDDLVGEKYH